MEDLKRAPATLPSALSLFSVLLLIPNTGGAGLELPLNSLSWMIFCVTGLLVQKDIARYQHNFDTIACLSIAALLLVGLTGWAHPDSRMSLSTLSGFLLSAWLFIHVYSSRSKLELLFFTRALIVGGLAVSALSWLEALGYRTSLFGQLPSDPWINGPFQQRNLNGSFVATTLVAALMYAGQSHDFGWRHYCALIVFASVVTISGSRTAWIGAFIGSLLILPSISQKRRSAQACASLLAGFFVGLLFLQTSALGESVASKLHFSSSRWDILYPHTLNLIAEAPIAGHGYGNYASDFLEFQATLYQNNINTPVLSSVPTHPHNFILFWWYNNGVASAIAITAAFTFGFIRIFKRNAARQALALLGVLTPIGLHMQLEFPLRTSAIHWLTLISLWAIALSFSKKPGPENDKRPKRPRTISKSLILSIAIAFCISSFSINMYNSYGIWRYYNSGMKASSLDSLIESGALRKRVNSVRFEFILLEGLRTGNQALLKIYVDWASNLLRTDHNKSAYQGLVLAYKALSQEDAADAVQSELMTYYPDASNLRG